MLIFNALAQRRGINLPEIGSLCVVSEPARMQENGKLIPPFSRVTFSPEPEPGYDEILWLIGESSGRDEAGSREIYDAWRSSVQTQRSIYIESVGEIVGNTFIPSEKLQRTLNPSGIAAFQLQRPFTLRQIFFWVGTTVIVGGGLAAGLITFLNSRPAPYDAPYAEKVPVAETLADDDTTHRGSATEEGAEKTLEALTDSDLTPSAPATDPARPTPSAPPKAKPASASSNAPKPSGPQPSSASSVGGGSTAKTPQRGEMRYYVVVGTYSTDENAERFIASARKKDASQNYRKLLLSNGKIMVYTADMGSDAEAQQQRRAVSGNFPDAWVFKRRAR